MKPVRIAWNNINWKKPSGPEGKSTTRGLHEQVYGFGYDEWLFDFDKTINGYHYGFIQAFRKIKNFRNPYEVELLTLNSISRKRFKAGIIKQLERIDETEAQLVKDTYMKNGWFDTMQNDILSIGGSLHTFNNNKAIDIFNIKFSPNDALLFSKFVELNPGDLHYNHTRYSS